MSVLTSKSSITISPSVATGLPFKKFTEYSKISPAAAAVTVPEDKSTFGGPSSAAPSSVLITTEEESETPFNVILPVLSLSFPRVMTVSPSMLEATSTFELPPDENSEGAPEPLNVIVSFAASKSVIITLPSSPLITALPEKVTSYK